MRKFVPFLAAIPAIVISSGFSLALTIETVPIGKPSSAPSQFPGDGAVPYAFRISKYEVTNSQYVEFLNAVAATDTYSLFVPLMESDARGGIVRSGSPGTFTYSVKPPAVGRGPEGTDYSYENKPVVFVSWYESVRFTNWLHNGQGNGDTESGAYTLEGPYYAEEFADGSTTMVPENYFTVSRSSGARWWLPNEDEWYKAAAFDPVAEVFYDYPTGTNSEPNNNLPSADTGNSANFRNGDINSNGAYTTGDKSYPLTDVGAYALSDSPFGTFDQLGNATEWIDKLYGIPAYGGLRGSGWIDVINYDGPMTCCWWADDYASFKLSHVGFRVATFVPEPTSAAYVAIGMLGLLHRSCRLKFAKSA